MGERTGPDQAFQLRPSVKLLERRDAAVPGCGGDARTGVLAYELASAVGFKYRIFIGERSYMLAVLPAIQAAQAIVEGRFARRGLLPPTEHVDPNALFDAARSEGITMIAG